MCVCVCVCACKCVAATTSALTMPERLFCYACRYFVHDGYFNACPTAERAMEETLAGLRTRSDVELVPFQPPDVETVRLRVVCGMQHATPPWLTRHHGGYCRRCTCTTRSWVPIPCEASRQVWRARNSIRCVRAAAWLWGSHRCPLWGHRLMCFVCAATAHRREVARHCPDSEVFYAAHLPGTGTPRVLCRWCGCVC